MPHIIIEYSENIHDAIALDELIGRLHRAAIDTGVFPAGGTRTRAAPRRYYRIADGHPDNGFIHVLLRVGHGRQQAVLQEAGQAVFVALTAHLAPLFERSPLAISMDIQEIDPVLTFKHNNLHEYVNARAATNGKEQ